MPLLPSSQRDQTKLAIAVVAVAIAGYYYAYPYSTRAAELDAAREHVQQLETQNEKARAVASKNDLAQLRAEGERAGAGLAAMRRLVPTEHEVPALLEEISTSARRAGLEVSGVAPDPVLRGAEFDTFRYRITLVGGYHALTTFLANVGSLPRIVAPVTFALTPSADGAGKAVSPAKPAALAATVTLQAYVVHSTPAPAPATPASPAAARPVAADGEVQPTPNVVRTSNARVVAPAHAAPKPAPNRAPNRAPSAALAPKTPAAITIEREVFSYAAGGRRDPFKSLLTTTELRPMLAELRLVAVAFDPNGVGSVAILRDMNTKAQHRVRVGSLLGRMRVTTIRPKAVVFTIEELGFSRQETLGLNDSTAVRGK